MVPQVAGGCWIACIEILPHESTIFAFSLAVFRTTLEDVEAIAMDFLYFDFLLEECIYWCVPFLLQLFCKFMLISCLRHQNGLPSSSSAVSFGSGLSTWTSSVLPSSLSKICCEFLGCPWHCWMFSSSSAISSTVGERWQAWHVCTVGVFVVAVDLVFFLDGLGSVVVADLFRVGLDVMGKQWAVWFKHAVPIVNCICLFQLLMSLRVSEQSFEVRLGSCWGENWGVEFNYVHPLFTLHPSVRVRVWKGQSFDTLTLPSPSPSTKPSGCGSPLSFTSFEPCWFA